jgi:muconolactone delta-isomerase
MEFLVRFTVAIPEGTPRADVVSREHLNALFAALPLADWMDIEVTPLQPHPNDTRQATDGPAQS